MVAAQGACPNCGAPIAFAIGASVAKVCEYCRHTVVRSDRGLSELGKAADLAPTSSLIGVGDEGTLAGRPLRVMGRVQLDYGSGPWDEYFVAYEFGQAWGWIAYAQGRWHATVPVPGIEVPEHAALAVEQDVRLGQAGNFRVAEVRTARIVSAEGELPGAFPAGFVRHYADLHGQNAAFATIDYGDTSGPPIVYLGWTFTETALSVVQLGPRSAQKVGTTTIRCPNCSGDVPALAPNRSERLGCPYCGAVSDIAEQTIVSRQEAARSAPIVPIGSRGLLGGKELVVIALMRRASDFEGEKYEWEEYLLFNAAHGYEWLVRDPETGWSIAKAVNISELGLSEMPKAVTWMRSRYRARNQNTARVTYVLGEVYWKCRVGDTTHVSDFAHGEHVLSREQSEGEVNWSSSAPVPWPVIARAFSIPENAPGGRVHRHLASTGFDVDPSYQVPKRLNGTVVALFLLVFFAMIFISFIQSGNSGGAVVVPGGTFRGGGIFSGGK